MLQDFLGDSQKSNFPRKSNDKTMMLIEKKQSAFIMGADRFYYEVSKMQEQESLQELYSADFLLSNFSFLRFCYYPSRVSHCERWQQAKLSNSLMTLRNLDMLGKKNHPPF